MAWRVTQEDVRDIIDSDVLISLAPFCDAANALTDRIAAQDSAGVLTTALLKEIERYLAAWFYEARDQSLASEKTADAAGVYQGQFGMGLDASGHGQRAKMLDVTGYLASLTRGRHQVSLAWLGLPPSEQTDYVDRD